MANKLTKRAVTQYHPGQAASPGMPSRCFVRGYTPYEDPVYGGQQQESYMPMSPAEAYALYARKVAERGFGSGYGGNPRYEWNYSILCTPAVPPTTYAPGYNRVDMREGWNASAESIFHSPDDFAFAFDYDRFPVGVIVGIAQYPSDGQLPIAVAGGVYLRDSTIDVISNGVVIATAPYAPVAQLPIIVSRRDGQVVVQVGDWQAVAAGVPLGTQAQVKTLLYLAGDYVDNPRFLDNPVSRAIGSVGFQSKVPDHARARGSVSFRSARKQARGSSGFSGSAYGVIDYAARAVGSAAFEGSVAKPGAEGRLSLGGLSVFAGVSGNRGVASARLSLPALAVDSNGGYDTPHVIGGAVAIPALLLSADVKSGTVGAGELALGGLTTIGADYPYGQGAVVLSPLEVFGTDPDMPDGQVRMYEAVVAEPTMTSHGLLFAVIDSSLGVHTTVSFALVMEAAVYDSLLLQDSLSFAATLEAAIRSGVLLTDQASRGDWPDKNAYYAAVQYATNALTGAAVRFEGFNFSSFCSAGQQAYGVGPDGLYEIGPNEEPIDALVEFAAVGGDTMAVKAMEYIYVGLDTDGEVYLAVAGTDGQERLYRAIRSRDTFRTTCGKGLRSQQWTVRMELVNATRATLHGVEWLAPSTARRWAR